MITARQLAPSSLGIGQGTCHHLGNVGDGREVTVLGEDKGMGEHAVGSHQSHREGGEDLGWLVGRRSRTGI